MSTSSFITVKDVNRKLLNIDVNSIMTIIDCESKENINNSNRCFLHISGCSVQFQIDESRESLSDKITARRNLLAIEAMETAMGQHKLQVAQMLEAGDVHHKRNNPGV